MTLSAFSQLHQFDDAPRDPVNRCVGQSRGPIWFEDQSDIVARWVSAADDHRRDVVFDRRRDGYGGWCDSNAFNHPILQTRTVYALIVMT